MAKALTVKGLEALKPGPARREIPDGLMSGLYIVIQPSGAMSWAVRYRFNGTPKKHTLGNYPGINLSSARQLAGQTLTAIAEGRDPSAERKEARRAAKEAIKDDVETVVSSFIERYAKTNMKDGSRKETERLLNKDVVPTWKGRSIKAITRRDVVDLLDEIVDRGAPVGANCALAAIRRLFNWCAERGIVDTSPVIGVKAPTAERSRDRVLSDDELRLILRAADTIGWPFGPFVRLLALTGQRRDEVAAMRWAEVDRDQQAWTIPAERAKNGVAHVVPLSPEALEIVEGLPRMMDGRKESAFVFTTTGKTSISGYSRAKATLDETILATLKVDAAQKGGDVAEVSTLPAWRFHDLRRTMASGMARLGVQIHVVEKVLNHTSGSFGGIVGVYQRHNFADEKKAAMLAWGRHVAAIEADTPSNIIELKARTDG